MKGQIPNKGTDLHLLAVHLCTYARVRVESYRILIIRCLNLCNIVTKVLTLPPFARIYAITLFLIGAKGVHTSNAAYRNLQNVFTASSWDRNPYGVRQSFTHWL